MVTAEHSWLTPAEAADVLRCSRRTIYRMVSGGVLAAARLPGGGLRLRQEDLDALLEPNPPVDYERRDNPWRTVAIQKEDTR